VNPADEPRLRVVSSAPPSDASSEEGQSWCPARFPWPTCTNVGTVFDQPAAPSAVPECARGRCCL